MGGGREGGSGERVGGMACCIAWGEGADEQRETSLLSGFPLQSPAWGSPHDQAGEPPRENPRHRKTLINSRQSLYNV